jgi:hypothetical protein
MNCPASCQDRIRQLHAYYSELTGQTLSLGFDRERLWFEYLRAGFTLEQLSQVIRYLQKEIRQQRRNVGALKLSNLLQLDRFEEDLNISQVRLHLRSHPPSPPPQPTFSPTELEQRRLAALDHLKKLKRQLN